MRTASLSPRTPPALKRSARALTGGLRTPADSAEPLFAHAPRLWQRLVPYTIALAFAVALLPVTTTVLIQDYRLGGGWSGALATAQSVPLLLAVTRPLRAWWIIFAADVIGAVLLQGADGVAGRPWPWTPMAVIGYLLLMACLGLREPRRTLLAVWLATGAAGFFFELISRKDSGGVDLLLFVLSGVVLVVTAALRERGDAQRRLVVQETISEAERSRRTLLEERARIARELHDVVAHHMSVITVQADSAPYRIEGLPDAAREEFSAIAASARESLTEMRRLLSVLRSDGTESERAPQPGLGRVPQLVEATVRAGVPAEVSLPAGPVPVPSAVDLSAYRIVQEALANVVRHASGARTRVSVTADGDWLTVLVVNGPAAPGTSPLETTGTGHGLVGMRERVRLTGGTLDTGPLPDGGFRVAARLPLTVPAGLHTTAAPAGRTAPAPQDAS
ncbi:sensor histidine kinase [Streptomyces sp. AK02-01A]|uniref:sensor histidine kinase n=1 Tax=Streptomyces sp. AK02-01A TaxID=3028648 RepID=UPI0029AA6B0B|nr:sensor histidine kinase [Streptomyces sp. AK02-01A]MDX3849674.1 sensor histidine kinase [Streptomyces sp. AK02-01A]MDX3849756.1 sensor histidine kinase [Streptomyces sp. AK02-01A]